jgi:hypothetical protein
VAEVATETRRRTAPPLAVKRIAIVPAFNEEESVTAVIDEIRAFDPDFEVVVVDDGSTDGTTAAATGLGRARRPPAVQPGDRRRRADRLPVRVRERLPAGGAGRRATVSTIPPSSAFCSDRSSPTRPTSQ